VAALECRSRIIRNCENEVTYSKLVDPLSSAARFFGKANRLFSIDTREKE
jgi:hypothetical protein